MAPSKQSFSSNTGPSRVQPSLGRILVVDDEAPICELFSIYLRKHGYEVSTSTTATEAMALLESESFDLVTLDIELSDADGLELLAQIKQMNPKLPVIMVTGLGYDEELFQKAARNKASGYVSKTLPVSQLLMEIRRALAHV